LDPPTLPNSWLVSSGNAPSWKQFFANTSANTTTLGANITYNATLGQTLIGAGASATAYDGGSVISPNNQIVLSGGAGGKMYLYGTGAIAFPQNADGSGQIYAGGNGQVLQTRGRSLPPQWATVADLTGTDRTERNVLLEAGDSATVFETAFNTYLKFVLAAQGRYGLSGGGYDIYQWIQEWEWYYLPNRIVGQLGTNTLTQIRTIATNNSTSPGFWFDVSHNRSTSKIIITNKTSGQDPLNLQEIHWSATMIEKTALLSPY
jgi:hypothetical protein